MFDGSGGQVAGSEQPLWERSTTTVLPKFCNAEDLAVRLGFPVAFIETETEARHLSYVEIDGDKFYNVDVAEQEIIRTAQLLRPVSMLKTMVKHQEDVLAAEGISV